MLEIIGLYKSFGSLDVLKGIDLKIPQGQVVALLGPSGTGKSTLLRCINYLEQPEKGTIILDGVKVDAQTRTDERILELRRKSAMVFQNYNLFANKTSLDNIMLPLRVVQQMPADQARKRAMELLERVGLTQKAQVYPAFLSGGQQQRVGIARALAAAPCCILFDEPTSSLDPELVGEVLDVIRKLARDHNITMLIATHELNFARDIADRILFMDEGRIIMDSPTEEFFSSSDHPRVRKFLEQFIN